MPVPVSPEFIAFAQAMVERMLNGVVAGSVMACLTWVLLRTVGRQNSGTRFLVWFGTLLGIVSMPFLVSTTTNPASGTAARLTLPSPWALVLFTLWLLAAGIGLLRLAFGVWQLSRLRRSCRPVDRNSLHPEVQQLIAELRARRYFEVVSSDDVRVPTAIGFLKPAIIFPDWTLDDLSTDEFKAVMMHEFAHLCRWDDWTNLLQKFLGTLFFFHPAVCWVEKHLSLEREMACDEHVLARTEDPRGYAECLLALSEKGFIRRGIALANAAVARLSHTSLRLKRILDARGRGGTRIATPVVAGLSVVVMSCAFTVHRLPMFIGFRRSSPSVSVLASSAGRYFEDNSQRKASIEEMVPARLRTHSPALLRGRKAVLHSPGKRSVALMAEAKVPQRSTLQTWDFAKYNPGVRTVTAPTALLVVMQSEQIDSAGSMLWQVTVYRVTVFHAQAGTMNQSMVAKAI